MKFIDLSGKRFGKLTVLHIDRREKLSHGTRIFWMCKCDCGNLHSVIRLNLKVSGRGTNSCGCEKAALLTSHGLTNTREYRAWAAMIQRCTNPNGHRYQDYGGRGISICKRWMKFENFIDDMGNKPSDEYSLDRFPNNDGDYEPTNCRWATRSQQQRNKRTSKCAS